MSIINLFTKSAPTLGGGESPLTFDAVLEDTLSTKIDYTQFPIEIGADASDHGIIRPMEYTLRGAVSNNVLTPGLTDFIGGGLSNFFDNGVASTIAGLSAGFLAGSNQTRAGSALTTLIGLQYQRIPFDVDAVDVQLKNMVITSITRQRDPENENALEFVAELQELPLLNTVVAQTEPNISVLNDGDPVKTMAAGSVNKGETLASSLSSKASAGLARLGL